jgi:hypothetical protein
MAASRDSPPHLVPNTHGAVAPGGRSELRVSERCNRNVQSEPRRIGRALAVIAASAVVIAVVGLVYLHRGPTPLSRNSGAVAPRLSPSPKSLSTPWNGVCPPTEVKLTGVFQECASIDHGMSCPSGPFNQARILRLHGTKDDFILYIEVNGNYHGPGTYALAPSPSTTLGVPDGVAMVAVREWFSGRLWESTAGSVTIDKDEESGWVYAGLGASTNSPVDVELNIAGWWSCS